MLDQEEINKLKIMELVKEFIFESKQCQQENFILTLESELAIIKARKGIEELKEFTSDDHDWKPARILTPASDEDVDIDCEVIIDDNPLIIDASKGEG